MMGFEEFNFLEAPQQSSIERSTQFCLIASCWPDGGGLANCVFESLHPERVSPVNISLSMKSASTAINMMLTSSSRYSVASGKNISQFTKAVGSFVVHSRCEITVDVRATYRAVHTGTKNTSREGQRLSWSPQLTLSKHTLAQAFGQTMAEAILHLTASRWTCQCVIKSDTFRNRSCGYWNGSTWGCSYYADH